MKRKHKMNIGLVFFVVALFVVSSGMSAIVTNEVEEENNEENVITMNSGVTLDCGSIRVNGKPGSYPNVDYSCSAKDHSSVDVDSGCSVIVKVSYHLWAGGDDDKATARIWFTDNPSDKATFTTPNNNNVQEGTLQLTKYMDDSSSYSLKLEVEWRDYITTANILVGGIKPSDTSTITTKSEPGDLDVENNQITGSIHCDSYGQAFIKLQNKGSENSELYWKWTDKRANDGGSFDLSFGGGAAITRDKAYGPIEGGSNKEIMVRISGLPDVKKREGSKTINCYIDFENADDPNDKETVHIQITVLPPKSKEKSHENIKTYIFPMILEKFPRLFTFLQNLPAFQ